MVIVSKTQFLLLLKTANALQKGKSFMNENKAKKDLIKSIFEDLVAFSVASINLAKRVFLLELMLGEEKKTNGKEDDKNG